MSKLSSHLNEDRFARRQVAGAVSIWPSRNPRLEFNILESGFTLHSFKDVLETFSFGSNTRVTSNKRVVQYMQKLSEPTKSD
jgi:hypothetical protein